MSAWERSEAKRAAVAVVRLIVCLNEERFYLSGAELVAELRSVYLWLSSCTGRAPRAP